MLTNATFKIVSWDEEPFDEPEDGPKLTRGNLMHVVHEVEKVVGSLGGRTGSFPR